MRMSGTWMSIQLHGVSRNRGVSGWHSLRPRRRVRRRARRRRGTRRRNQRRNADERAGSQSQRHEQPEQSDPPHHAVSLGNESVVRHHFSQAVRTRLGSLRASADRLCLRRHRLLRLGGAAHAAHRAGDAEDALATALRIPRVRVTVAGRTDSGVHARGQVAHLDVEPEVVTASTGRSTDPPLDALARRVDGILPTDLRVRRISEAPDGFDARFSAIWRRYAYRIADAPRSFLADPLVRAARADLAAGPRPRRDELRLGAAPSGSRTSPPSASNVRARRRCAPCSTSGGAATTQVWSSGRSAPTPSATTWCGRWSAA